MTSWSGCIDELMTWPMNPVAQASRSPGVRTTVRSTPSRPQSEHRSAGPLTSKCSSPPQRDPRDRQARSSASAIASAVRMDTCAYRCAHACGAQMEPTALTSDDPPKGAAARRLYSEIECWCSLRLRLRAEYEAGQIGPTTAEAGGCRGGRGGGVNGPTSARILRHSSMSWLIVSRNSGNRPSVFWRQYSLPPF